MIPITVLEFVLAGDHPLDLGANPGSSLRGALYETLAAMYDTGDAAQSRYDTDTNLVAWLMRLEDLQKTGGKDAPRPIAIRPPQPFVKGEEQTFTMALYGRGVDAAPLLISAVAAMGAVGVGRNRKHTRYTLSEVRAIDPLTKQKTPILDRAGKQIAPLPTPPSAEIYMQFAQLLHPTQLNVQFLTPTRIVDRGALCHQPDFRPWFQRLTERIRQISDLYAAPVWIPFHDLLPAAEVVRITHTATRWQEMWSHSRIDGTTKPSSGFIGEVQYEGELGALLPYILVGQALQVGKNAIKGGGWYNVLYHWR